MCIRDRGKPLQEIIVSKLWLEGPEFLKDQNHDYEKMRIANIIISKENARLVKEEMKVTTPYFTNQTNQKVQDKEFTQFHLETNSKEPPQRSRTWGS